MQPRVRSVETSRGPCFSVVDVAGFVGTERHARLPYCLRVLLENVLRNNEAQFGQSLVETILERRVGEALTLNIPRVIMPDSTGVPILMDLASMRDALVADGKDPYRIDARVHADLVVDHSLQVDASGSAAAFSINAAREFDRNSERYIFIKWAQSNFNNLTIHPPGSGIIHQLNLETIAPVMTLDAERNLVFPDMVVGSDSHTPMINALGVVGWGVGGIEAETVLLGQPYGMALPAVVGVRLNGSLRPGVTTTDLALTVTEALRGHNLVGKFVEFVGPAVKRLGVPDRATLSNMAPEYGATIGYWPIDERTIEYLASTDRTRTDIERIELGAREAGLFDDGAGSAVYDEVVEINLSEVTTSMAGPSRPQDRIDLHSVAPSFAMALSAPRHAGGFALEDAKPMNCEATEPGHGAVVIAAITSCTNTANPSVMVRAGLLAKRAHELGLMPKRWVKTSLAPGSKVVTAYLEKLGLMKPLAALGFDVVGYGCTTCGGKSGPLLPAAERAIIENEIVGVSVLSGNRNFSGRIHKLVRGNYLATPALVVAYALAGRITIDLENEPLGVADDGRDIYLSDLWPDDLEVEHAAAETMDRALYTSVYGHIQETDKLGEWERLQTPRGPTYDWDPASEYLVRPPFLQVEARDASESLNNARVIGLYGHSLTTDHISPGGEIPADSPAGQYLQSKGISAKSFNTYVGRRGNHEVMMRATFANLRIQNKLAPEREGWWTRVEPSGPVTSVFDAASHYRALNTPLVVVGGREYGTGSSRDWAAKGPSLLGIRAVLAISFERIHRSNLAAMGIVPLTFVNASDYDDFDGSEEITIDGLYGQLSAGSVVEAEVRKNGLVDRTLDLQIDLRTAAEAEFILSGNVLKTALAQVS